MRKIILFAVLLIGLLIQLPIVEARAHRGYSEGGDVISVSSRHHRRNDRHNRRNNRRYSRRYYHRPDRRYYRLNRRYYRPNRRYYRRRYW